MRQILYLAKVVAVLFCLFVGVMVFTHLAFSTAFGILGWILK